MKLERGARPGGKEMDDVTQRFLRHLRAVHIAGMLNDLPGPWQGRICIGRAAYKPGMYDLLSFCFSLESGILDAPTIGSRTDTEIASLLCEYWGSLQEVWPEAFKRPEEYKSLTMLGVSALHWLFPEVFSLCQARGGWSRDVIKRLLAETGIDSEFWRTSGDASRLYHAPKCLWGLIEYLEGRLPKAC